jgi:pyruvate kinase
MRRTRRTRIVATLGPASSTPEMIERLFRTGADVFRINMSHTPHEKLREFVAAIRAIEKEADRPIGILADLQGPKLRLGTFKNGREELKIGDTFVLDSNKAAGTAERVHLPHPEILEALEVGHTLLVDDGKVRLVAREVSPKRAVTEVVVGGAVSDRKGVSVPDTMIRVSAMTPKDRTDLDAALDAGVDWIALSFVQRPDDVAEVKKVARGRAGVMAKIEKPQGVEHLEEIMELADAVMVARGDLGVELPLERVPGIQKRITRMARRFGKPVIVATQMLESMITSPVPTRAEVSDVSTAIFEGADAIMLSAESAAGKYPIEAVGTMDRIACEVERDATYRGVIANQRPAPDGTGGDAIANAAGSMADDLDMAAIVCWTSTGSTALRIARERPQVPILALSPNLSTARRLALSWGVHAIRTDDARDLEEMVERSCSTAISETFADPGERLLVVMGVPLGTPGATNMLRIARTPMR